MLAKTLAFGPRHRHLSGMTKQAAKTVKQASDFDSPDALARFKELAAEFNKKHNSSKDAALTLLQQEGIATVSGKLSKRYSG